MNNLLKNKKAIILGIANEKSIAWGIARAFKSAGAKLALSYQGDALKKRVEPLASEIKADFTFELDVTKDEHLQNMGEMVKEKWGSVDILVHSLAFANRDDLKGRFSDTSREGFKMACDISAFSLVTVCRYLREYMSSSASVIAMTYHGSQQVISNYKVMGVAKAALEASARYLADDLGPSGIRVNCISAGPVKTLAASAVPGLRKIFTTVEENAPLRRNITTEDLGGTATLLASDLSCGITGQIIYTDSGFSIRQL